MTSLPSTFGNPAEIGGFVFLDRCASPDQIDQPRQTEDIHLQLEIIKDSLVETMTIQLNTIRGEFQDQYDNLIHLMGLLMEDNKRLEIHQQDILSKLERVNEQLIEQAERQKNMRIRSHFMGGPAYAFMNHKIGPSFTSQQSARAD